MYSSQLVSKFSELIAKNRKERGNIFPLYKNKICQTEIESKRMKMKRRIENASYSYPFKHNMTRYGWRNNND